MFLQNTNYQTVLADIKHIHDKKSLPSKIVSDGKLFWFSITMTILILVKYHQVYTYV